MSNPNYASKETLADGTPVSVERMMFKGFDPNQLEEQRIRKENESHVFTPEFIPYYPDIAAKFSLSATETLVYGFIRFYMKNASSKFYFTNEQLAKIINCSSSTINISISNLAKKKLIVKGHKIKGGGGTIRFISSVRASENSHYEYQKSDILSMRNLTANNNKINNNKINNNKIVSIDTSKNARTKERNLELIKYYEEAIGAKLEGSSQDNWRYCTHLVNRLSAAFSQTDPLESTKRLIDAATKDEFHSKNANSFKYLFGNYLKIIKSHQSKLQSVAII